MNKELNNTEIYKLTSVHRLRHKKSLLKTFIALGSSPNDYRQPELEIQLRKTVDILFYS